MNLPVISVLMPVYNCSQYICEAIDSILNQTFADFEFLIIDDASTDDTILKIKSYDDRRIQLIEKPENTGYTNSLNYGLSIAKGKYIARMDGDDVSLPERFEKQYRFLEEDNDVVLCGTNFQIIDTDRIIFLPETHEQIKIGLLNGNKIAHPSVMMRSDFLRANSLKYDVTKEPAEDYDMWVRILKFGKVHNLQEVYLHYRVHKKQVSSLRKKMQAQSALDTRVKLFTYVDNNFDESDTKLLKIFLSPESYKTIEGLKKIMDLQIQMVRKNEFFEKNEFSLYIENLRVEILNTYFLKRKSFFPALITQYFYFKNKFDFKIVNQYRFIAKSLLYYSK